MRRFLYKVCHPGAIQIKVCYTVYILFILTHEVHHSVEKLSKVNCSINDIKCVIFDILFRSGNNIHTHFESESVHLSTDNYSNLKVYHYTTEPNITTKQNLYCKLFK